MTGLQAVLVIFALAYIVFLLVREKIRATVEIARASAPPPPTRPPYRAAPPPGSSRVAASASAARAMRGRKGPIPPRWMRISRGWNLKAAPSRWWWWTAPWPG